VRATGNSRSSSEYGITDHLDAAIYQVFGQPAGGGGFTYEGYKVRLRYRIAEKNVLPLDILLYAEHVESTTEDNEFEGKLVLAKDIGKLNIATIRSLRRYTIMTREQNTGYAAGVSYELTHAFTFGIESKGNYTKGTYAAGPTSHGAVGGFGRTSVRSLRLMIERTIVKCAF